MASQKIEVGTVVQTTGFAFACDSRTGCINRDAEHVGRPLHTGSKLYLHEYVFTPNNGSVVIMDNNGVIHPAISGHNIVAMNTLTPDEAHPDPEVAALQEALIAGLDPAQLLAAAAAGLGAPAAGLLTSAKDGFSVNFVDFNLRLGDEYDRNPTLEILRATEPEEEFPLVAQLDDEIILPTLPPLELGVDESPGGPDDMVMDPILDDIIEMEFGDLLKDWGRDIASGFIDLGSFDPATAVVELTEVPDAIEGMPVPGLTSGGVNVILRDGTTPNTILGLTEGAEDPVFILHLEYDAATQIVTVSFALFAKLDHPDATDPNDIINLLGFTYMLTVPDFTGDGVPDVFTAPISVSVLDDGPAILDEGTPGIDYDETAGLQTDDEKRPHQIPDDLKDIIGDDRRDICGVAMTKVFFAYGADGPGEVFLSDANGSVHNGTDSGLLDTQTMSKIFLYELDDPNVLVGRVGNGDMADENGDIAFYIYMTQDQEVMTPDEPTPEDPKNQSMEEIWFVQMRAIKHPDAMDPNDSVDFLDGVLNYTVVDFDGDSVSNEFEITIFDDGPSLRMNMLTHDETKGVQHFGADDIPLFTLPEEVTDITHRIDKAICGAARIMLRFDYGKDGAGNIVFDEYLNTPLEKKGVGIVSTNGLEDPIPVNITTAPTAPNVVIGHTGEFQGEGFDIVFVAIVTDEGKLFFVQYEEINHWKAGYSIFDHNDIESFELGLKVTDGDGDMVTGDVTIKIRDDGPKPSLHNFIKHDETPGVDPYSHDVEREELPPELQRLINHLENVKDAEFCGAACNDLWIDYGKDENGRLEFKDYNFFPTFLSTNGKADPKKIFLVRDDQNPHIVKGVTLGGEVVFVGYIDVENQKFYFVQFEEINHPHMSNPDDMVFLPLAFTVIDGDGDKALGLVTVKICDDGPSVGRMNMILHDETPGVDRLSDDVYLEDLPPQLQYLIEHLEDVKMTEFCGAACMQLDVDYGKDENGKLIFKDYNYVKTDLTTNGKWDPEMIFLHRVDQYPNVVKGVTQGGEVVFIAYLDSETQKIYFVQFEEINHPDMMNFNDIVTLDLGFWVIDGDGDKVMGNVQVKIRDDGPSMGRMSMILHDETKGVDRDSNDVIHGELPQDLKDIIDELGGREVFCGAACNDLNVDYGKDENGKLIFKPIRNPDSGLSTNGKWDPEPILLMNYPGQPNIVKGVTAGGEIVFLAYLDSETKKIYFVQFEEINHPDGHNPNDIVSFDLGFWIIDGDGDKKMASVQIKIRDDGPSVGDGRNIIIHDETPGIDPWSDDVNPRVLPPNCTAQKSPLLT